MRSLTLSFLVLALASGHATAQTTIWGGTVSGTWTAAGSPYIIKGDISANGLTIQPGVVVKFDAGASMTVATWVNAGGTTDRRITFTSNSTGLWGGIRESSNAANPIHSRYEFCTIEKAAGGFTLFNSTPSIKNCVVQDCARLSSAGYGGGIRVQNASGTLAVENTIIQRCQAYSHGGAVYAHATKTAKIAFVGCSLLTSTVNPSKLQVRGGFGGGAYLRGACRVSNCLVRGNRVNTYHAPGPYSASAYSYGGGLALAGSPTIENTVIVGNLAEAVTRTTYSNSSVSSFTYGGGVYFDGMSLGTAKFTNVIIARNHSSAIMSGGRRGGKDWCAVHVRNGTSAFVNCTIARNTSNYSSAFGVQGVSKTMSFRNSIIYDNTGAELNATTASVNYCCIEGGHTGTGNIMVSPGFLGPKNETISRWSGCCDMGDPVSGFDDKARITIEPYGPGARTKRNDIGAHGGPGNAKWVTAAALRFSVTPNVAVVSKKTAFKVEITGGNTRFPLMWLWQSPTGLEPLLISEFGSERSWELTLNFTPTQKGVLEFMAASLTPNGALIVSPRFDLTIK